jgi:hypothetical protein
VFDDVEAIRRLIALYGQLLDDRRFEAWSELFCEEAEFLSIPGSALPGGGAGVSLNGRAAILETVSAVQEQLAAKHPVIHFGGNAVIDVIDDRASAWWDFLVMYLKPGGTEIAHAGRYYADIARRDGRWRFLRRVSVRPGYPLPPGVHPTPAE